MTDKNMGWQCHKCLVVYAPSVEKCKCSVLQKEPTVSLSGGSIVGLGVTGTTITSTGTTYICTLFMCNTTDGICSKCGQPEWKHYNVSYT